MFACPNPNCAGNILVEVDAQKPATTDTDALHPIRCSYCGHAGFLVGDNLHLVFRAGQEFCFTIGSAPACLIVSLPAESVYAYQWLGLSQEALARHAVEWLLLLGYKAGVFSLSPSQPKFAGFKTYLESRVPKFQPHVA